MIGLFLVYLLYFYKIRIKKIIFTKNYFNSCYIYIFFLQLIILKFWSLIIFINSKTDWVEGEKKKNFSNLNFLKLRKTRKISQFYGYWLRNVIFKKKKLTKFKKKYSKKYKKQFIYPRKIVWWARNLLRNDRAFTIKILLKKRNIFLTLINNKGKTFLKHNIGSCGFKKKKKFTGFSIEQTTLMFFLKAKRILKRISQSFYFRKVYVNIYIKNSFKFWPYRFIKKGIRKSYFLSKEIKLNKLRNFIYNSHSKGLRLRKKRRL